MPTRLMDREDVRRLAARPDTRLVEVQPWPEYRRVHLPGAHHFPLDTLDAEAPKRLDPSAPVVVYGADYLCDLSARAAARLEQLGFDLVHDYAPGKADWLAAGLPREGDEARDPVAGDAAQRVPTCVTGRPLRDALGQLRDAGQDFCAVVDEGGVVIGTLSAEQTGEGAEEHATSTVDEAMQPGPVTVRASVPLAPLLDRMARAGAHTLLITDPEGHPLGQLKHRHGAGVLAEHERTGG